jgi:NAD(P)-dependent dehydrogenase (short-subunit alcohol dehydrogenase family)
VHHGPLALARELARRHWNLVVDAARQLWKLYGRTGAVTHIVALPGDVVDRAHRRALVVAARALRGSDVLINNASPGA